MDAAAVVNLVIAGGVVVWVLVRDLTARPLKETSRLGIVLFVVGIVESIQFLAQREPIAPAVGFLLLSVVIGVGLACGRAISVRLWHEGDQMFRQGNWVTLVLWIIGVGQHFLLDRVVAPGLAASTILLYLGIVIIAQRQTQLSRARGNALRQVGRPPIG
ncbi:MAG: hypothetical protein M3548_16545 [Actinomycetota bacterium]|nr:hypothetical protein [Actinomycetota bacterium]